MEMYESKSNLINSHSSPAEGNPLFILLSPNNIQTGTIQFTVMMATWQPKGLLYFNSIFSGLFLIFLVFERFQMERMKDIWMSGITYLTSSRAKSEGKISDIPLDRNLFELDIDERIKQAGYPVETHEVTTEDGYILTMYRIPHGRNSEKNNEKPVLIMHGLCGSSYDFALYPDKSLAYSLADNGYDVWLGNSRGTTYSRKHAFLEKDSFAYWKFSVHEMGIYDIPAKIDHILATTKRDKLCFIGYSISSAAFCIGISVRPEYNEKISLTILIAPAVFVEHFNFLGPLNSILHKIIIWRLAQCIAFGLKLAGYWQKDHTFLGIDALPPLNDQLISNLRKLCLRGSTGRNVAIKLVSEFLRIPLDHLPKDTLSVFFNAAPNTTSFRELVHGAQHMFSGRFQYFDYGTTINKEVYNNPIPPEYDLGKITVPVAIFHSKIDILATAQDVEKLAKSLPNVVHRHYDEDETYGHFSILYGSNADKNNPRLLKLLREKTN